MNSEHKREHFFLAAPPFLMQSQKLLLLALLACRNPVKGLFRKKEV
jgi:hypothetical protein